MSENTDHETGGTFVDEDVVTEQCSNIKFPIIQSSVPSSVFDGQVFIDTDDDPQKIQVYDNTNTAWVSNYPQWYETITDELDNVNPAKTPVIRGTLVVQYNSTTGKSYLYVYVNSGYSSSEWVARSDS